MKIEQHPLILCVKVLVSMLFPIRKSNFSSRDVQNSVRHFDIDLRHHGELINENDCLIIRLSISFTCESDRIRGDSQSSLERFESPLERFMVSVNVKEFSMI